MRKLTQSQKVRENSRLPSDERPRFVTGCEGKAMKRFIAISLLGVAYLVAAPLMAITVFEDGG